LCGGACGLDAFPRINVQLAQVLTLIVLLKHADVLAKQVTFVDAAAGDLYSTGRVVLDVRIVANSDF